MAIATDSTIDFFGDQDPVTVVGGTTIVTDTSWSAAGDVVATGWTNDDDAPLAMFVLKFQYPAGTIVADGIHLYVRLLDIDGANNDEPQPDAGWPHHYLGTFVPDTNLAIDTDDYLTVGQARLPNSYTSQVYEFYIENQCDVSLTAGWTIKITPITMGPHG